jgi:NADH-quinone oxidoreductase subunit L
MIDWTNANFLPWLIPVPPLIAVTLIFLVTNRSWWLTVFTAITATLLSWGMALAVFLRSTGIAFGEAIGGNAFGSDVAWMDLGSSQLNIGVLVDPLTVVMLFMVPLAITMIMIYSVGYMAHDPRKERFLGYMSLFAGAMLTLVVADNLLLLFIGWEVMGFCSYSLIGFWFEKKSAYKAGVKAFMTTRVADVFMLLGIAYLYASAGTLNFRDIFFNDAILNELASTPAFIFGSSVSAAGLIGVFLVLGTVGKSAQFPLHVWLPDAMEGPTPVSAMIHAAAMVSAGVYMVIRMYPLFTAGADPHHGVYSAPLLLMAYVGGFTALFSAIIAVAQNDVKRVLAYSTISQLGFMVAALGIGAYVAAAFHLITHGIFKALLFMSSGSIIHAMEHGEHHAHEHGHHPHNVKGDGPFDPQDMRNMGGLKNRIPVTWYAFLAGGMALAGFPLITAGFWSKDEILAEAWYLGLGHDGFGPPIFVFIMLVVAAFLTAFYTTRQISMTFVGEPRTEAAAEAGLGGPSSLVSILMQGPLVLLAFFAIVTGFAGVHPDFPVFGWLFSPDGNPFHDFVAGTLPHHPTTLAFNFVPVLFSFAVALGGIFLGWYMYWRKPMTAQDEDPAKVALDRISPVLWTWMENKFYVDELYDWAFVRPSQWVSDVLVSQIVDRGVIDGVLHFVAEVAGWIGEFFKRFNRVVIDGVGDGIPQGLGAFGRWFRSIQSGNIQQYMLMSILAALVVGLSLSTLVVEINALAVIIVLVALVVVVGVLNWIGKAWGGTAE